MTIRALATMTFTTTALTLTTVNVNAALPLDIITNKPVAIEKNVERMKTAQRKNSPSGGYRPYPRPKPRTPRSWFPSG